MKLIFCSLVKNLIFSLLLSFPIFTYAAVYQCSVDGKTSFQSTPCVKGEQKTLRQDKSVYGMHGTWFKRPKFSLDLSCDEKSCTCGKERYRYPYGAYPKIARIKEAMDLLQSAWAEGDYLLSEYRDQMNKRGKASGELTQQLKLNGCEIKFAQHTLKTYFGEVSTKLYGERDDIQARINAGDKECVKPAPIDWEKDPNNPIFEEYRYKTEYRAYQECTWSNDATRRDNEFNRGRIEQEYREIKRNLVTLERPRIKQ